MSNLTRSVHFRDITPLAVMAMIFGVMSSILFYETDVFWQDTGFFFGLSLAVTLWGLWRSRVSGMHHLYLRDNAAIGAARLGVIGAVVWCGYVLLNHADPTITGIWTVLYVLMAMAAIKLFGQFAAEYFGPRLRVDIYERKNLAAGTVVGSFTFATGLIFGGAMWGDMEADALEYGWLFRLLPGYEDGWWITPWFFLMGWAILFFTMRFWFKREHIDARERIVRERNQADANAFACFCIACAITIAYAVQGDYTGFFESLAGFSIIALPILAHEIMRPANPRGQRQRGEGWIYIAMALIGIITIPWVGRLFGMAL